MQGSNNQNQRNIAYVIKKVLGEGSFGKAYIVECLKDKVFLINLR